MGQQVSKKTVKEKRTQVRFRCTVLLEEAIERYMYKKGVEKSDAIEFFLMGSKTLQQEMEAIKEFHGY